MKRIALVLLGIFVLGAAYAGEISSSAPEDHTCIEGESNVVIKTRYGVVKYEVGLQVDGRWVSTNDLHTMDTITFKKLFQLGDEDVLLSAGGYRGNTSYEPDQDFLLVLGPGKAPQVVLIPGDTACPMWQEGNALYTGGKKDECGNKLPIIRFEHDKFIIGNEAKPTCIRKPYVLHDESCQEEFEFFRKLCSSITKEKCKQGANVEGVLGYADVTIAEMGAFNSTVQEPYFNKQEFNNICLDWCKGNKVLYAQYRKSLCMAR